MPGGARKIENFDTSPLHKVIFYIELAVERWDLDWFAPPILQEGMNSTFKINGKSIPSSQLFPAKTKIKIQ